MSEQLDTLVARLKAARGTSKEWMAKEVAVTRFLATLPETTRVFCRGEVHAGRHFPAILTLTDGEIMAWAPSGKAGAMAAHPASRFWSSIPHASIAREVLDGPETRVLTQDIRKS